VSLFASAWFAHGATQIIADHTIVDRYDDIPASYMAEVKKMMVSFPGESHSVAYRTGMTSLMGINANYAVNVSEGSTPQAPTDQYLRVNQSVRELGGWWGTGSGEAHWYTWYAYPDAEKPAVKDRFKNHILYCHNNNFRLAAIGFGWCWDTTWHDSGWTSGTNTIDPVYQVHWDGSSKGGPDGITRWGLDDDDIALTGNRVTMNTYLNATEEYRLYAISIGAPTKVIFTTSPADGYTGENGYQRYLKHEHIRNFVKANPDRILFDYSDILCYDDDGTPNTTSWNGHTFPQITTTNLGDGKVGHIGAAGALRLAKAQWWMLARIAGWDGIPRTSQGVPHSWLDAHNLVTNGDYEAVALSDTDNDGVPAWREFWCDTQPTNSESCLALTELQIAETGVNIYWKGGVLATQYLERLPNLTSTGGVWQVVFTNQPPTAVTTNFFDQDGTNSPFFYRIRVVR
jgi:hypothetical protein